jgi:hypothetical protein
MKKVTLLVAGLLFATSLAQASETNVFSGKPTPPPYHNHGPVDYRDAEPIVFLERGIEFMVFPNGELDFNTEPSVNGGGHSSNYYRRGVNNSTNRGTRVEHDSKGRVRRVGNVFINYDYAGRVKRIGNIYMDYGRYGLSQIGYLRLLYDNYGHITGATGYINQANRYYVYEPCNDGYNGSYNGNDDGYNTGSNHEEDHYYYRKSAPKQ